MKRLRDSGLRMASRSGFTAVEVFVVVGVLVIMAGIAMVNLTRLLQSDRLSAASREVVSQLRIAQTSAIKTGRYYRFVTRPGQPDSYRIEMSADNAAWPMSTDTVVSTAGAMPRVIIDWVSLSGEYPGISVSTPNTVPFDFRGAIANSGGSFVIALAGPNGGKTITINHSGGIIVQ